MTIQAPHQMVKISTNAELQPAAPVQEVFSSAQGEGPYVGRRQIFVRFAHCHLKCAYCDTPMTTPDGRCHVETIPGQGYSALYENPMGVDALESVLLQLLGHASHHSVSFTGGEPLLYHRFLKTLLPRIQPHVKTYLETSGTQPEFLAEVLPWVDIIAMDIKLPSTTHETPQYNNQRAFYDLAQTVRDKTELFIKLVVNDQTLIPGDEMAAILDIVQARHTPIIIQPETSLLDRQVYVSAAHLFRMELALSKVFEDVRIIPQTHKMLNVM